MINNIVNNTRSFQTAVCRRCRGGGGRWWSCTGGVAFGSSRWRAQTPPSAADGQIGRLTRTSLTAVRLRTRVRTVLLPCRAASSYAHAAAFHFPRRR